MLDVLPTKEYTFCRRRNELEFEEVILSMSALDDLRRERSELGKQDLTGKTLDQVMAMANRAQALDMRIAEMERNLRHTTRVHPALHMPQASRDKAKEPVCQPEGSHTSKQPYRGLSELSLGKYAMTVLAAGLCLLALAILLAGFWAKLMGGLKFALILAAGCGLMGLGLWRLKNTSRLRPFWLGVSGLGSGVVFMDAMAGIFIWELYGLGTLGCILVVWLAFSFLLGYKKSAGVFYAIAYIGGALTVWLAGEILVPDIKSEVVVAVLILTIAIMGRLAFWKTNKPYLLIMNIVSAMVLSTMAVNGMLWYYTYPDTQYDPVLLPWVSLALALVILWDIRHVAFPLPTKTDILLQAAAAFISTCFLNWASALALPVHYASALTALGLCFMGVLAKEGYILGVSIPAYWILAEIWPACGFLIPCCVATALIAVPKLLDRKWDRAGVTVLYAMSAWYAVWASAGMDSSMIPMTLAAMVVLLAGLALYLSIVRRDNLWVNRFLELLVLTCMPGFLTKMLYCTDGFPLCLPDCLISLSLLVYGTCWLDKQAGKESGLARFLWYILRAVVYVAILLHSALGFFSTPTKAVVTGYAIITAAWHVWSLGRPYRKPWAPVIACLLSNWHMWALFIIWDGTSHAILISLVGLVLAVGFIWMGFRLRIKSLRHMGLVCAIMYSIKLALFDVGLFDTIGSAGGLLLAGLICFGISLVYNKKIGDLPGDTPDKEL